MRSSRPLPENGLTQSDLDAIARGESDPPPGKTFEAWRTILEYGGKGDSLGIVDASLVKPQKVEWFRQPYIPNGRVTILEGDPGLGKSSYLYTLAAEETAKGRSVFLFSGEDPVGDVIRPRLDAYGGDASRLRVSNQVFTLSDRTADYVMGMAGRARASLIVFDPLVAYMGEGADLSSSPQAQAFLHRLEVIALGLGCAVIAVRHLRKSRNGRAIDSGMGSISYAGRARSILLLGRTAERTLVLAHSKCNVGPLGPSRELVLTESGARLGAVSPLTADDLCSEHSRETLDDKSRLAEAVGFVRDQLGNGPMFSAELDRKAKAVGVSKATLYKARRHLKCHCREGKDGVWIVSLPEHAEDADRLAVRKVECR